MSDEGKERLLKHINHVFNECREYIESKNNDCLNCLEGADTCYQVYEEMKRLIQHQPEIDEDETLGNPELMASIEKAGKQIKEGFIIQPKPEIEVNDAFMKRWKKEFHDAIDAIKLYEEASFGERVDMGFDMVGDERDSQLSRLIPEMLKEAGVKIISDAKERKA